jgi:hypothetical protein
MYTGFTWLFSDFTNANFALISDFEDVSFTPIVTFSHDLFQGAVLTVSAQTLLGRDVFSGDSDWSFGCAARLRLRF